MVIFKTLQYHAKGNTNINMIPALSKATQELTKKENQNEYY